MTIVTRRRVTEYTVLPNEIANDDHLSFEARGLLAYLLSKPDNWKILISDIQKQGKIGRDKAYRLLGELRERGYVQVEAKRSANHRFTHHNYIVYDCLSFTKKPLPENPEVVQLLRESPLPENQEVAIIAEPLPENPYTGNQDGIINKDNNNNNPPYPPATESPVDKQEFSSDRNRVPRSEKRRQQELANELFSSLWSTWPEALRPNNRILTEKRFHALTPKEQEEAYTFADAYLRRCQHLKKTPLLLIYLTERRFLELADAPIVDNDGLFVIERGSREWDAWKEFIAERGGASTVQAMNEKDHILRSTRLPDFKQLALKG